MGTHDHARLARLSRRRAERREWAANFDAHLRVIAQQYMAERRPLGITIHAADKPEAFRIPDYYSFDRAFAPLIRGFTVDGETHVGRDSPAVHRVAGVAS